MTYAIGEKGPIRVMGMARRFHDDTAREEIPRFWDEDRDRGLQGICPGRLAVCLDDASAGEGFTCMIGRR